MKNQTNLLRKFNPNLSYKNVDLCNVAGKYIYKFVGMADNKEQICVQLLENAHSGAMVVGSLFVCAQNDVRIAPLFWVEGKPVYRDDILYHPYTPRTGSKLKAEFRATGDYAVMRETETGAVPNIEIANLTWVHPKTKHTAWLNIYPNTYANGGSGFWYDTEKIADDCASENRVACIEISWEA